MDDEALVDAYYDAIDAGEYDRLRDVLAEDFAQERGDRTFEDREAFVSFMRDDRPETDTTHELQHVTVDGNRAVAEGILRRANGDVWFHFADAFEIEGGRLLGLRTYTF